MRRCILNPLLTRWLSEVNFKPVGQKMENILYEQFNTPITERLLKQIGKRFFRAKFEWFFVNQEDQLCDLSEWIENLTEFFAEYESVPTLLNPVSSMMSVAVSSQEIALKRQYAKQVDVCANEFSSIRWNYHQPTIVALERFELHLVSQLTAQLGAAHV